MRTVRPQPLQNSKLHAVADGEGRPIMLMLSEGQMSDHTGAKLLCPHLPAAETPIADKGAYLADIKASDQAVLYPENMTAHRVEQQAAVEIARGQADLDLSRSIRADREGGWLRTGVDRRPLSRPVVADAVVPVDMPAFQPVGPHDVPVHGRQQRFHVAGVETIVKVPEKFCVAGHRALLTRPQ